MRKHLNNFFKNKAKVHSDKSLWTTFKKFEDKLKKGGYTKAFLACNARTTNDYSDRIAVAYMCNPFPNPILKGFFAQSGVSIDENRWALSECLRFLFQSAIKKDEPIQLYIPSFRMTQLVEKWMAGEYDDPEAEIKPLKRRKFL